MLDQCVWRAHLGEGYDNRSPWTPTIQWFVLRYRIDGAELPDHVEFVSSKRLPVNRIESRDSGVSCLPLHAR